jgi:undecaprenyl-diphosphatase
MPTGGDRRWPRGRVWAALLSLGALGLLGLRPVGDAIFAHGMASMDGGVRHWALAHRSPALSTLFLAVTAVGGITGMRILSVLGAVDLWRRSRRRAAAGAFAVSPVAFGLFTIMKTIYARPRPPALGAPFADDYAFPSGHATMSAAVCCTLAYLYWRHGLVRREAALAFAILVPLLVGMSRVYLDMHWTSDVVGGWSVGLLVAIVAAALCDDHVPDPSR